MVMNGEYVRGEVLEGDGRSLFESAIPAFARRDCTP
jgi:hypothetical protein